MVTLPTKPKISIGIPVYNGEDFLQEALDSILAQTFTDFEVIISDNASTDRTSEICRTYARKDKRIRYQRCNVNRGASWNFNHVFKESQGEYFKWVAADDAIEPNYLECCVEMLNNDSTVVLACTNIISINEFDQSVGPRAVDHNLTSPSPYERWVGLFRNAQGVECIFGLIRSCELAKTSLLKSHTRADFCLLQELVLRGKFQQLPEHLIRLRTHPKAFHAMKRRRRSGKGCVVDHESARKRAEWFDPANKNRLIMPRWALAKDSLAIIAKSNAVISEKVRMVLFLLSWKPMSGILDLSDAITFWASRSLMSNGRRVTTD